VGIIFDATVAFFAEDDWPVTLMGQETAASVTVRGENGYWDCVAQAVEEDRLFLCYSVSPFEPPRETCARMEEFVARANYGTLLGNFELDVTGGDLRYKTSLSVRHIPDDALREDGLLQCLIRQAVYANVAMMDRYLPGIRAVLLDGVSPGEAIAQVEG
jgi:hypothetical protein